MERAENRYLKLSRKDVSAGVESKGGLSYLSWAYCWNLVSEEYPDANFYFTDPHYFPDESVMVKAVVTIDGKTMEQPLPVMDNRNRAIKNPDARAISDAQQRALVKACSLFGVGIALYLGEALHHVVSETPYEKSKAFADAGDFMGLHEYTKGLSEKDQIEAFNAAPMGSKQTWKNEHRALMKQAEEFLQEVVAAISEAVTNGDAVLLSETIDELNTYERTAVWARLNDGEKEAVKTLRTESGVSA